MLLRVIQSQSMRFADGVIFLTEYAAKVIQQTTGRLRRTRVIPHGVGKSLQPSATPRRRGRRTKQEPIRCVYVSNASMYKHQWVVVKAISHLAQPRATISS